MPRPARVLSHAFTQLTLLTLLVLIALPLPAAAASAAEPVDLDAVNRIRDEGLNHSQAMETAEALTTEIGARLTGSPQLLHANEWTRDRLTEWGLQNAHLEAWGPFGRGWSFSRTAVHMVAPFQLPLIALPQAWTPGTDGPVRGEVLRVKIEDEDDLDALHGKIGGKILLLDEPRPLRDRDEPQLERYDGDELRKLMNFDIPEGERHAWRERYRKRLALRKKMNETFTEEGVVATIEISSRDSGLVRVGGAGSRWADESAGVPALVMASTHYDRLVRLYERAGGVVEPADDSAEETADGGGTGGEAAPAAEATEGSDAPAAAKVDDASTTLPIPELEIDVTARFWDDDPMAYNTIAEIPGTDLADQVVMLGGHLDSWHAGTGATDDGAGVVMAMEAVRILEAAGLHPRRTIRIALWSGEEQGLLGSRAYVSQHFASRPEPETEEARRMPSFLRKPTGPLTVKPEHAKLSAYFNVDNGGGKIRGIYAQENAAAAPIFEAWLAPLHDLGATTVTLNDTGSTDHVSFDRAGLPGFQFIQDDLDYFTTTHHTNADTFDHLEREDLVQGSVVLATFVWQAANRDEMIPRKPMPRDDEETE